jgi:hypothetical protein
MKFGKTLQDAIEDMQPEFRDKVRMSIRMSIPRRGTLDLGSLEAEVTGATLPQVQRGRESWTHAWTHAHIAYTP